MGLARHKVFQGNAGMSWFLTKEDPSEYPAKTLRIRLRSTKIQRRPHTTIKGVRSVIVDFPTTTTLGFWQMVAHPFIDLVHQILTSVNGKQRLSLAPKLLNLWRGWIGVCKSADPLKLMAESVDPLKKSTKSESAITDPSRISALLFLVIFSAAWHRHIRKRKWAFRGNVEIHDPNFQTTKIQNPGP